MKRLLKLTGAMVTAIALGFAGTASGAEALSNKDKEFLKNASELGMAEVEMGKLAAQKATNPDLKAHGEKLVADHSKANEELLSLAQQKGVKLEAEPTSAQKRKLGALAKQSGAEFDKEFAEQQVKDHKKAIREFQEAANEAKDPDVKAFAAKQLPALQRHLAMFQDGGGARTTDAAAPRRGTTGAQDPAIRKEGRGQQPEGRVQTPQ